MWYAPLIGYGFAWVGHFFFEKNKPATFKYPLMSLRGDFVMWFETVTGTRDFWFEILVPSLSFIDKIQLLIVIMWFPSDYQLFNILFASLPIIWFGIYDKKYSYEVFEKHTDFYKQGMKNKLFHTTRFWKWVIYGMLQGLIIAILCYYSNSSPLNNTGRIPDLWSIGSIAYACIVIIVNLRLFCSTNEHTIISTVLIAFSILSYFIVLFMMSYYYKFENFNDFQINFTSSAYYFSLVDIVSICILLDVGLGKLYIYFGLVEEAVTLEKIEEKEKEKEEKREILLKKEDESMQTHYYGSAFSQDPGQAPQITRKVTSTTL